MSAARLLPAAKAKIITANLSPCVHGRLPVLKQAGRTDLQLVCSADKNDDKTTRQQFKVSSPWKAAVQTPGSGSAKFRRPGALEGDVVLDGLDCWRQAQTECAIDCSGKLTGGCSVIEDWHLPYTGVEVEFVSNQNCKKSEEETRAPIYHQDYEHRLDVKTGVGYGNSSELSCTPQLPVSPSKLIRNFRTSPMCSYEEVVHRGHNSADSLDRDVNLVQQESAAPMLQTMEKCLMRLTQWALTLHEVYEDRIETAGESSLSRPVSVRCVCAKAMTLHANFAELEKAFREAIAFQDACEDNKLLKSTLDAHIAALADRQLETQSLLKSFISINVSAPISFDSRSKAAYIVREVRNVKSYVRDAVHSLVELVNDLLNVDDCAKHKGWKSRISCVVDTTDDEDFFDGEESMEVEEEEEESDEAHGNRDSHLWSRKRKQAIAARVRGYRRSQVTNLTSCQTSLAEDDTESVCPRPISPLAVASKRPRSTVQHVDELSEGNRSLDSPAALISSPLVLPTLENQTFLSSDPALRIKYLEKNKKYIRTDGLFRWVLWKETWRSEWKRSEELNTTKIKSILIRRPYSV